MCLGGHVVCVSWHINEGQRIVFESWFSPSTGWVPEMEPKLGHKHFYPLSHRASSVSNVTATFGDSLSVSSEYIFAK